MVAHLNPAKLMPKGLALTFRVVDFAMLGYWAFSVFAALRILKVSPEHMYAGYGLPFMAAWNWSFAPLDIIFSLLGLYSVSLARRDDARWLPVALVSLGLTFCAGLMAIAFWAIIGFFNASWWTANISLMIVGLYWGWRLIVRPGQIL